VSVFFHTDEPYEGRPSVGPKEHRQCVGIAKVSACEMKYRLILVKELKYTSQDKYYNLLPLCERVRQMVTKLAKSLE
jgi:four helix bundle protein